MTVGKRIKERRKELKLSVDEVAAKLEKNRATIYRYESDDIENLPITILEPLAKVLETTPAALMGWNEVSNPIKDSKIINDDRNTQLLLSCLNKLNVLGKQKALERIKELTYVPKYCNEYIQPIAAHDDEISAEELQLINEDLENL
ncbi:repressor [Lachnospiraceae bacterium KM106-2]|nr:repressor [Lachnospiraceae bacterium KM106-2]